MSWLKIIFSVLICLCFGSLLQAQVVGGKKSPFTMRGTVGGSSNFYSSNETYYTRPSFAWNINGNFIGKVNEVTLPLSFVINQYGNSNSAANLLLGVSPTYKWTRLHLGYRNMNFSPLTYGNQTFRGVGIELNPKHLRFGAFYGRLNKSFNEDTSTGNFRLPQYSRLGYGVKIGVGNSSRFLDLIYFHAKDDSSSATLTSNNAKNSVRAQENAVLGTSFKIKMIKKLTLTGDVAISGLTQDLSSNNNNADSTNSGLGDFMDNFLSTNDNVLASYGGQSSLSYYSTKFNSSIGYRRIQPNFKTLGTPYLLNDIELITLNGNHYLAKGKLTISENLSQQHNNLDKNLYTELRTQTGNLNANAILNKHLSLNLNYSGYILKQKNGDPALPDSLRLNDTLLLNQYISIFNIGPSYILTKGNKMHYMNANISLQSLADKNPSTAAQSNSNNLSASANYSLSLINKSLSFSIIYLYSKYRQEANSYNSNGVTLGTSSQLLKNKMLNVQGSIGYYFNKYANTGTQSNLSYSANISYNAKRHALNVYANYIYTPTNNAITDAVNKTFPYAVATENFAAGISYHYSIY